MSCQHKRAKLEGNSHCIKNVGVEVTDAKASRSLPKRRW
jgi:hypothetical protein